MPTPAPGELPPGLPPISGLAETSASLLAVTFLRAHADSVGDIDEAITADSYGVTLEVHDNADFIHYAVEETAALISARYVMRDGLHSELLTSVELTGPLDGGLVYAQFDNDSLTAMAVHLEVNDTITTWVYPEGSASLAASGGGAAELPGLSSPAAIAALDELVASHLEGPANELALGTFRDAVDEYFALSVPEPGGAALLFAGGALAASLRPNRSVPSAWPSRRSGRTGDILAI